MGDLSTKTKGLLKKIQEEINRGTWCSSNLQDEIRIPFLVEALAKEILNVKANYQIVVHKTHLREDSEFNFTPVDLFGVYESETILVIKIQLTLDNLVAQGAGYHLLFSTQYFALYPESSEHILKVINKIKRGIKSFSY